jgi:hypothetical protein
MNSFGGFRANHRFAGLKEVAGMVAAMKRSVRWSLLVTCGLATLAGCARMWTPERPAWRGEAEVSCLESGSVREGPAVHLLSAIDGPGACGADHPLRILALGAPAIAGFGDEVIRPPGGVGGIDFPGARATPARPYAPAASYSSMPGGGGPSAALPGEPLSLAAPGMGGGSYPDEPGNGSGTHAYAPQNLAIPRQPGAVIPLGRGGNPSLTAGPVTVSPTATLACPVVSVLDRFVTESIQPAAMRWFGQPVAEIKQISAYSCRGMNGNPNATISEHAFGNALDIAAFTLADGRRITVKDGWHASPPEQGFLHDVQSGACEMFTTVLAPGSNQYHYDHIHVDLMRRSSGRRICQPAAIPGELAAARAGGARYGRSFGEPSVTGAIDPRRLPGPGARLLPGRPYDYGDPGRKRAIPGED